MTAGPIRLDFPDTRDRSAGFTLVEMLVVLVILALVAGLAGAAIARRDTRPPPIDSARAMQGLLLRARSDAILRGRDTAFLVDPPNRAYAYPRGAATVVLPAGQTLEMTAAGELVTDRDEAIILFRPDGSSSGAELRISDQAGRGAAVRVNWLTGIPLVSTRKP